MGVLSKTCVIMGAGEIHSLEKIREMIPENSFVISADGGLEYLEKMQISPDLIVGDFDSLSKSHGIPRDSIVFPSEKDDTDTEIALNEAIKRGFKQVLIFGGTGGRLDHTIANLSSLIYAAENGVQAFLIDERNKAFVLSEGSHELDFEENSYVSFFNFGCDFSVISLTGFKYPLEKYKMKTSYPIGVSNEFAEKNCLVRIERGIILAVISKK